MKRACKLNHISGMGVHTCIYQNGGSFSYFYFLEFPNPYLTNGFSYRYQLDESIFIFRSVRSDFILSFFMKFFQENRIAPDGTPRFAASHLGLFCLRMSHERGGRLK